MTWIRRGTTCPTCYIFTDDPDHMCRPSRAGDGWTDDDDYAWGY